MGAISGGKLDRETEHWILWELPLSRGWQYYHAAIVANGSQTIRAGFSQFARLKQLLENFDTEALEDEHE